MSDRYLPPGIEASGQAYEILIDHEMHALSGAAWKVACYLTRRTIGFGKETDAVSLTQICGGITTRDGRRLDRGTGLSRKAAVHGLRELHRKGLLLKRRQGHRKPCVYSIDWLVAGDDSEKATSSESTPIGGVLLTPPLVAKGHPQPTVQPTVLQPSDRRDSLLWFLPSVETPAGGGPASLSAEETSVKECLQRYVAGTLMLVSDDLVGEVLRGANGATPAAVVEFLDHKRVERRGRYAPGGKCGPRSGAWFVEVVKAHFNPSELPALPPGYKLAPEVRDSMMAAFDSTDVVKRKGFPS